MTDEAPLIRRRLARDREPEGDAAMNHLLRELAPITDGGWEQLEDEARRQLVAALAARKLVDFSGPHGWQHSATNLGRTETSRPPGAWRRGRHAARAAARRAARALQPRARRARRHRPRRRGRRPRGPGGGGRAMALAENVAVFHGWEAAGIIGMTDASPHEPIAFSDDLTAPRHIARAVEVLLAAASAGPTASRSAPRSTRASSRPPSTAATRSSTTCARSSTARSSGRPGSTERSW